MASLGRLEFTIQDTAGNAVNGATVEVRRQGAQVFGAQSGTPITVDAINGVLVGDVVVRNSTSSPTKAVTAITGTTISLGGGGFPNVADDDRLSIASTLPTIYEDAEGNTSTSNPLTTDANGFAGCYIVGGKYDVLITASGTATLRQDVVAVGGENVRSNIYNTGTGVAWITDTLRTLGAGDKVLSVRNNTSEIFAVKDAGISVTGTAAISGATSTGALSVTGTATATTTVIGGTGVTATTGDVTATAGDSVFKRARATQGTAFTAADANVVLSAGWGNTASFVMNGKDACGVLQVTANGAGIAASPTVTFTYKDGAWSGSAAPLPVVCRGDEIAPTTAYWSVSSFGTTTFAAKFVGLPVAGSTYWLYYVVTGR